MQLEPGSPQEWLSYARSDLALARAEVGEEVYLSALCFHAQQAVEKSIKALLVLHNIDFPKTHSIERLTDMLPECVSKIDELMEAATLTAFATTFRYPGIEEPVTEEQYKEAVNLAEVIVKWAHDCIQA